VTIAKAFGKGGQRRRVAGKAVDLARALLGLRMATPQPVSKALAFKINRSRVIDLDQSARSFQVAKRKHGPGIDRIGRSRGARDRAVQQRGDRDGHRAA